MSVVARDITRFAQLVDNVTRLQDVERGIASKSDVAIVKERLLENAPAVRISVAAGLLEVGEPTIRAWMKEGVLRPVAVSVRGRERTRIDPRSLVEIFEAVAKLRAAGRDRNLREALLYWLADERDLNSDSFHQSLDEMRQGQVVDITPQDD